ncbi:unnamed protein product [Ectocarpus sp. CCAP 1310/34]|nr:unnamed protein product [Ectocarpus sp. CCAP 1310/34]
MVASFHSRGISPPFHTLTRMVWRCPRTKGSSSSILSNSAGRESWPGAFQFLKPFVARTTNSSSGTSPNR